MQSRLLSLSIILLTAFRATCLPTNTTDLNSSTFPLSDSIDAFEAKVAEGLAFLRSKRIYNEAIASIYARSGTSASSNPDAFTSLRLRTAMRGRRDVMVTETNDDGWSDPVTATNLNGDQPWAWANHGLTLREAFRAAAMAGWPGPWHTVVVYWPGMDIEDVAHRNNQVVYWLQNHSPATEVEGIVRVGAKTGKVVAYQGWGSEVGNTTALAQQASGIGTF